MSTAGHRVNKVRRYGGMVFACDEVSRFLSDRGITLLLSAPFAPEQNGVSERENHTVVELARSMLSVNGLRKPLWAEACETEVYNRTGKTPVIGKSPTDMWNGHVMKNLDRLRVFGTESYVYIPKQFRKKFYTEVYLIA